MAEERRIAAVVAACLLHRKPLCCRAEPTPRHKNAACSLTFLRTRILNVVFLAYVIISLLLFELINVNEYISDSCIAFVFEQILPVSISQLSVKYRQLLYTCTANSNEDTSQSHSVRPMPPIRTSYAFLLLLDIHPRYPIICRPEPVQRKSCRGD